MSPTVLVFSTLAIVLSLGAIARSYSTLAVDRAAHRLARRVGLPLDPAVEDAVRERVQRRLRFAAGGTLIAVAVADALLLSPFGSSVEGVDWALIVGAILLGAGGGSAVGALTLRAGPVPEVRVARASQVTLADYLPPLERIGARVVIALAVVLETVVLLSPLWSDGGQPSASYISIVALTALGVVSLLVFELAGRRLIARPQPAGSPTELAWDDALRSVAVRDLATAPIAIGLYGVVLGGAPVIGLTVNLFSTEGTIAVVLFLSVVVAAAVALAIISSVTKPQSYFLRRLWPELATELEPAR